MKKTIRATFHCSSVDPVIMHPVYTGTTENTAFFKATSCGYLEMRINNPSASSFFKTGKDYDLHFSLTE